ncbi:GerW family sporulation protein [Carboxydothermus pertinax]|uniref:Sporulation protein YtfJ n=1 Tax=Carboxydothermus pertinax TaxID=870242 RepID=A0A1L8CTS0_9THEO|nr:GerW family sporulation protein [Carboxydothermus pertinax]GAV22318.1 sporulation protein YtfJ [Carboxydothermus pertinax]
MEEQHHPIESLMKTAMESIKEMVDVDTVVGSAVETPDGSVIIPVSKVTLGFAAGGSEFSTGDGKEKSLPFGGGSGAGVSVQPVGFLVVGQGQIRLLPVDTNALVDKLIDMTPDLLAKIQNIVGKNRPNHDLPIDTFDTPTA